jgi:hypothetical protein
MNTHALVLDCERRLGGVLVEILHGLAREVTLVTRVEALERRMRAGGFDVLVVAGVCDEVAMEISALADDLLPECAVVLLRGLIDSGTPRPAGRFVAVLDEPFSPRRFRDVTLAVLATPELVLRRTTPLRPREIAAASA